ncbi:hypothetical protein AMAG_14232 [Allomyces macrogynus ATCC 38327]|uniref:Uncharacterized protein n=1 Tax=Allomyces macrogynus (strain ATCC 38327) TaxID=578462 RepID=A0A0L0T4N9_ALLM3|nr:hypothetical protein AMAG_14232 [Allomyces macrogynus ATCC 38327]|eukprot:KNE69676.1 hypothetical protein AMAG_14232 [Allomyces macrogynus ATCC 38327]
MTHAYIHVESAGRKHAARPAIVAAATRPAARVGVVEQIVPAPAAYYVEERVQVAQPRTTHFTFVEQVVQPRTVTVQQSANAISVLEQESRVYVPRIEAVQPRVAIAEVVAALPTRRHRRREAVLVEEVVAAAPRKQIIEYVEDVIAIDSRRERRAARLASELATFDAEVDFVAPTELAVLEAAARRQRRAARHVAESAPPARAAQAAAVAEAIAIDEYATAPIFPAVTEIDVVAPRRSL